MIKKGIRIATVLALLLCLTFCLSGCMLNFDADKYMTRNEVEDLIGESMLGDVTVEGGDSFDITIEGVDKPNVVAAAKGLMSSVSVSCYFEYKSGYGPSYSGSKTELRKGAGVIYQLDKNKGDAYIVTNYHVVYEDTARLLHRYNNLRLLRGRHNKR